MMASSPRALPAADRLRWASAQYYNRGLASARAGDLERAALELEKALRYDKENDNARDLLGLVEYERGELGRAVRHWSVSQTPRAVSYLAHLREDASQTQKMEDCLQLYNEAYQLACKGDIDFAMARLKKAVHLNPHHVRAQLLLALCYMEIKHYKTALRMLDQVARIDPLNADAMRYRLQIEKSRRSGEEDASVSDIQDWSRNVAVQNALPEPDIHEIFQERRSRKKAMRNLSAPLMQILLFAAGFLCSLGFTRLLWYPQEIRDLKNQLQQVAIDQSRSLAEAERTWAYAEQAHAILEIIQQEDGRVPESTLADLKQLLENGKVEGEDES